MPTLSPVELLVVAVLALIVFGPQKLPEIARTVGRALNELRRQASDLRSEFQEGMALDDQPEPDLADDPDESPEAAPADKADEAAADKPDEAAPADKPPEDE